jgi:hypothetical protein
MTPGPASFTVHDAQRGQRNRYMLRIVSMQQRIVNAAPSTSTSRQVGHAARTIVGRTNDWSARGFAS